MPTRIGRVSANEYHSVDWFGTDIKYKVIETPCTDETTNVVLVEDTTDRSPFGSLWNAYARFKINDEVIGVVYSEDYDSAYQFFKFCVGKTVIVIKKEKQEIPNVC
jgi:hypothetical protein